VALLSRIDRRACIASCEKKKILPLIVLFLKVGSFPFIGNNKISKEFLKRSQQQEAFWFVRVKVKYIHWPFIMLDASTFYDISFSLLRMSTLHFFWLRHVKYSWAETLSSTEFERHCFIPSTWHKPKTILWRQNVRNQKEKYRWNIGWNSARESESVGGLVMQWIIEQWTKAILHFRLSLEKVQMEAVHAWAVQFCRFLSKIVSSAVQQVTQSK
jgi:hypothetical protein